MILAHDYVTAYSKLHYFKLLITNDNNDKRNSILYENNWYIFTTNFEWCF